MALYILGLNKTIKLKKEFGEGNIAIIQSETLNLKPLTGSDNTSVNVLHGGDYLLHISIRRKENAIVFNSKLAGGNWGPEERKPLKGAFVGPNTSITVYDHGDRYQVLFNYRTIHYYKKRIPKNADSLSYRADGLPPPFSDQLAVNVYDSLGGISPAGQVEELAPAGEVEA